jgi:hypothetical protein
MEIEKLFVLSRRINGLNAGHFLQAKLMRRWCILQSAEVASQPEGMAKEWEKRSKSTSGSASLLSVNY